MTTVAEAVASESDLETSAEDSVQSLTLQDRCDRCNAQAFVRVNLKNAEGNPSELLFCGHHGRKYTPSLVSLGAEIIDETDRINTKPSISANAE